MNKKLLCILLCMTMLMTAILTSCTNTSDSASTGDDAAASENTEATRLPMTLSLWLPTDKSTTDEAISLVETEINKLTQSKYNTAIELHAIDSDQYQSVIDKKINDIDEVKKSAQAAEESRRQQELEDAIKGILPDEPRTVDTTAEDTDVMTAETEINEYGQTVDVYPAVEDDQLDIFLIKGYDKYIDYIDNGLIEALDADLNDVGKKLYAYIYPSFFDLAKVEGSTYAIPNNHAIGEYQLLLVNKELVEQFDYSPDEFQTFVDCESFITDIGNQKISGVTPLLGEVEPANMVYFSSDGKWSVIGSQITAGVSYNSQLTPVRTLEINNYAKTLGAMRRLNSLGFVGNGDVNDNPRFAVGVVKGDASLFDVYSDDYYINIHGVPVADSDEALKAAFAVSTYSKDITRSMEIITYLNTDETMKTLLQYGVEGVHWEKVGSDDDETIRIISNDYKMNILDTGNEYLTYPGEGLTMSYWDYAKKQNLDSSTNPFVGFDNYVTDDNRSQMQQLAAKSADVWNQLQTLSPDDFEKGVASISRGLITDPLVDGLMSEEGTELVSDSIILQYNLYYSMK